MDQTRWQPRVAACELDQFRGRDHRNLSSTWRREIGMRVRRRGSLQWHRLAVLRRRVRSRTIAVLFAGFLQRRSRSNALWSLAT